MNNKQNYFKIKDLFNQAIDADNSKRKSIRALLDTDTMEEMNKFIAQIEKENPKIEKLN